MTDGYYQVLLVKRHDAFEGFTSMLTFLSSKDIERAGKNYFTLKGEDGEWKIQLRYEHVVREAVDIAAMHKTQRDVAEVLA